jgi:hypothetical protein
LGLARYPGVNDLIVFRSSYGNGFRLLNRTMGDLRFLSKALSSEVFKFDEQTPDRGTVPWLKIGRAAPAPRNSSSTHNHAVEDSGCSQLPATNRNPWQARPQLRAIHVGAIGESEIRAHVYYLIRNFASSYQSIPIRETRPITCWPMVTHLSCRRAPWSCVRFWAGCRDR